MSRSVNLVGRRFGKLTVVEKTCEQENHYWTWRCRCDCGKEIIVNTKHLTRGTISNCGCEKKNAIPHEPIPDDLTGKRYGRLVVLRLDKQLDNGKTSWFCQCDCGNQCVVTSHSLHNNKRKSCGCLHRNADTYQAEDLRNRKFGRLTVVEPVIKRNSDGSIFWKCRCECGTELNVSQESLLEGYYRSCGCIRQEIQENLHDNLTFVENTCVEIIERRKSRSDNKSGFRGVSKGPGNKWLVTIGFQGKRYYIGLYSNFNDAVVARLRIEEVLHDGFLEAYQTWKKLAEEDQVWAKENPFFFHVTKNGSDFYIESFLGQTTVSSL